MNHDVRKSSATSLNEYHKQHSQHSQPDYLFHALLSIPTRQHRFRRSHRLYLHNTCVIESHGKAHTRTRHTVSPRLPNSARSSPGRMLLTPRTYELAQVPDAGCNQARPSYFLLTKSTKELRVEEKRARRMLLLHQTGSVKVGEVVR